jgi:hypothetical protein
MMTNPQGQNDRTSGIKPVCLFERRPPIVRDAVAFDFDRRGARVHRLCHDRREPGEHIDHELCNRLAGVCVTYNGRSEGDTMWSAVCLLQRQLADAGFAPK